MAGRGESADVVVVGAGSAGCAIASVLSRDRSVVLVERGPLEPAPWATLRLCTLLIGPGASRAVRYPEARGRDVVRGTGVGGSSAVNGGYFLRGHESDYERWPWPIERISAAFDVLDGGGVMHVSRFADAELGPVALRFEEHWRSDGDRTRGHRAWPAQGVNRVRSNRTGDLRRTVPEAFPLTSVRLVRAIVTELIVKGGRVGGVITDAGRIVADDVVLTAGTLGTGVLVAPLLGPLRTSEHAERIVRFHARVPLPRTPLLQTVEHTVSGLEVRCYGDDFAEYIPGLPRSGVPIGVSDMTDPCRGTIRPTPSGVEIDLGVPDERSASRLGSGVDGIVEMLHSDRFSDVVTPGSVTVDPVVGMSSHAWGTLPLGTVVDRAGRVAGISGLRVADGSVLPTPLRSGPHATVIMTALMIAEEMGA